MIKRYKDITTVYKVGAVVLNFIIVMMVTSCNVQASSTSDATIATALESVHDTICDDNNYKKKYCDSMLKNKGSIIHLCVKSDKSDMPPELYHYCQFIWND